MNCPVCSTELKIAERMGIEIDHCPKCRGIWLDRGELDKIIERSAEGLVTQAPLPPRDSYPPRKPDWDDDDDRRRYGEQPYKKKRSFIEDIFDF